MKRRDLITGGLAAAGVLAAGSKPARPSTSFVGVRSDHTPDPRYLRDLFAGRHDGSDRVRIEWVEGRRVFYVDIGAMPPAKAERYLFEIAANHKKEITAC